MNICSNKYEALQVILDQKILAIFHGSSELGPRALGRRSLLFDPRNLNAKTILNNLIIRNINSFIIRYIGNNHINNIFINHIIIITWYNSIFI